MSAPQPPSSSAYTTAGNPASSTPSERTAQHQNTSDPSSQPVPRTQASAAAGAHNAKFEQGAGIHGAPAGEEAKGLGEEDVGRHRELDGEQMAAAGEGRVAEAVRRGGEGRGGGGSEPELVSDLDRKKAEQKSAREEIMSKRAEGMVDGGVGQTGGPASTV